MDILVVSPLQPLREPVDKKGTLLALFLFMSASTAVTGQISSSFLFVVIVDIVSCVLCAVVHCLIKNYIYAKKK